MPSARPEADRSDDWFDAWLTDAADLAGTRQALAAAEAAGWTVLRDLHRPGSTDATVEHVAVGHGGVVVVETLRWTGEVTAQDGTLRHRGYGRTADVAAVADAAGAVTALLAPAHRRAVRAVVSLAGRDLDPAAVRGGATVVGEPQLAAHLAALETVFSADDVALVAQYLAAELGGPASPEQLTVDDVFRPPAVWQPDARAAGPREPGAPPDGPTAGSTDGSTDGEVAAATDDRPGAGGPPRYTQPANREVGGLHAGQHEDGPDRPSTAAPRGAVGDGLLRVGLLVLGLLTVGNVLLAWLDAAH
ncbi:NERD domain-containing protein [Cellulomonas sp. ACRRI]|uniref:NERD domain-containing protein n=1 Tax=Cellulomonas sp. ACRRI TaxID=2918188 RepID=UPI001EF19D24|nr:NERD domain-containing protein [Cellulomonas sp. ACRRI]MCG7284844.1 NERD domain-containing protein [Cellulomonas sp. ACRRI]